MYINGPTNFKKREMAPLTCTTNIQSYTDSPSLVLSIYSHMKIWGPVRVKLYCFCVVLLLLIYVSANVTQIEAVVVSILALLDVRYCRKSMSMKVSLLHAFYFASRHSIWSVANLGRSAAQLFASLGNLRYDCFRKAHLSTRLGEVYLQCQTCIAPLELMRNTRIVPHGNAWSSHVSC